MPTGLADGLGLESDPVAGYPAPFAPSSVWSEDFGSPASTPPHSQSQLRLLESNVRPLYQKSNDHK